MIKKKLFSAIALLLALISVVSCGPTTAIEIPGITDAVSGDETGGSVIFTPTIPDGILIAGPEISSSCAVIYPSGSTKIKAEAERFADYFKFTIPGASFIARNHSESVAEEYSIIVENDPTLSTSYSVKLDGKKITVSGKEITVVTLHLDWSCKEKRACQLDSLIAFAKTQEYCILIGDFNPENLINGQPCHDGDSVAPDTKNMYQVDWKRFDDAGLEYANGGRFGTFGTIMKNGAPASPYPWDNIVVTPNIKIQKVEVFYEPWMNDHAIVAADLEIL